MPKLPILSAKELVKIFEKAGYFIVRQKGSHIRMRHENMDTITIPNHKIIGRGLLKKILRDSKISADDLVKLAG
ncbi:MAG: type II toxin-antitoxin system HicA family toxin [Candidatus Zambryskibacteria bacterium]|nr:type II toxin-antitoxin system HicA family toxin [Candidatus Zambryskibacteria bacterium]